MGYNALNVNFNASVAEVALARLVQEGVAGVGRAPLHLFTHTVLALHAVACQVATLSAGFGPLDPGDLGDFSQGVCLCGCSSGHPCGHAAPGNYGRC